MPTSGVKNSCDTLKADTVHAIVLLMCHTHYTPTQPETPGLIDNTLPNKNQKTNVMNDMIFIDIQWQTGSVNSGPVS